MDTLNKWAKHSSEESRHSWSYFVMSLLFSSLFITQTSGGLWPSLLHHLTALTAEGAATRSRCRETKRGRLGSHMQRRHIKEPPQPPSVQRQVRNCIRSSAECHHTCCSRRELAGRCDGFCIGAALSAPLRPSEGLSRRGANFKWGGSKMKSAFYSSCKHWADHIPNVHDHFLCKEAAVLFWHQRVSSKPGTAMDKWKCDSDQTTKVFLFNGKCKCVSEKKKKKQQQSFPTTTSVFVHIVCPT